MASESRFRFDPRIKRELLGQKRSILIGVGCSALAAGLYGWTLDFTQHAVDSIDALHKSHAAAEFDHLAKYCGILVAIFLLRYIFVRFQTYYLAHAVAKLTTDLRRKLMSKLLRLPVTYFNEKRSGAVQSILTNDVNVFQSAVQILRDSVEAPIKATVSLAYIVYMQWEMAVVTFLMIPVLGVIVNQNAKRMRKAQAEVQVDLADVGAVTQETLQGVRVVKAFGAEAQMDKQYAGLTQRSLVSQLKTAKLVAKLKPLVELLGAVGLILAFLIGGWLALHGDLRVSKMVVLAIALDNINQGFRGISGLSNTYSAVQAAADRIYGEILEVPEPPEHSGSLQLKTVKGEIEFRNVSFAYPDGTPALRNVSFTIEPGTSLALVGPSGAGKSTIADLLLRFYEPSSGDIFVDGVNLRDLDVAWLRNQVGVVPQQTFLFAGSIDDNLRLGAPDATEEQIGKALRMAHAENFTAEFRERNLPVLGERGVKLSGGQMQRVAIARALIREPSILLLDEATSALDAASEQAVTEALQEVMETRTTLFIAHRLTTAARATRILLLKKGEVVEIGSHRELVDHDGEYAALFRLFSAGVLEDSLG
ncbi:MAG: ATP-binding cassette domain-containing protein [Armatimonadetes bacterium]|nr:ATP-binding cassette domain-containing protein [Armatimonadota bacterium]MBS1727848.1 ABC transporter ATP-binding protein [Armatimonadota bacterium]